MKQLTADFSEDSLGRDSLTSGACAASGVIVGLTLSARARIFVAPIVIAIATVSSNSSLVAPDSFATAKLYEVQGSHPAAKEAARAIRYFIFLLNVPRSP